MPEQPNDAARRLRLPLNLSIVGDVTSDMTRFFCVLLLLPAVAFAQNQKLSERPFFESEPFIAMDAKTGRLCAAWMSARLDTNHPVTIVYRTSEDGGTTWSLPSDLPHLAAGWQSADVSIKWLAIDTSKYGYLFISYVDYLSKSSDSGAVVLWQSVDHSAWRVIDVNATGGYIAIDRPWFEGYLHWPSLDFYEVTKPASWHIGKNHTFYLHWTGKNVTAPGIVDGGSYPADDIKAPMGSPAVTYDGTFYVAYPFFNPIQSPHGGFALATPNGQSFSRKLITPATLSEKDSLAKAGFRLVASPNDSRQLTLVWVDGRNADYDVFCVSSTDAGDTWSDPLRINDDPIGNGVMQDMVWPTYASDGTLVVVWRDRRNGTGSGYQSASDTYYAFSRDGGKSFSTNYRLSDSTAQYKPVLDNPGNDFLSVVATHDSLYAVWADTRTGAVQVYFAKAALGGTSWVDEQSLSSNNIVLSCYPNPASNSCKIEYTLDKPSHCAFGIVSEDGAVTHNIVSDDEQIGKHSLDLSLAGLAAGNYWIEVRTESGVRHERLIIK